MAEKEVAKKTLKEQNQPRLWAVIAANAVLYAWILKQDVFAMPSLSALAENYQTFVPAGMMFLITVALNRVLSPVAKARLVFWRWKEVLPGHRAFTHHAHDDPRVDVAVLESRLGAFPKTGAEQNRKWFGLYSKLESLPKVEHVNREYLLLRDWSGLAALAFVVLGVAAWLCARSRDVATAYIVLLLAQYLLIRMAAKNAGERLVTTVLSESAQLPPP